MGTIRLRNGYGETEGSGRIWTLSLVVEVKTSGDFEQETTVKTHGSALMLIDRCSVLKCTLKVKSLSLLGNLSCTSSGSLFISADDVTSVVVNGRDTVSDTMSIQTVVCNGELQTRGPAVKRRQEPCLVGMLESLVS